jgi:hypothetical protein
MNIQSMMEHDDKVREFLKGMIISDDFSSYIDPNVTKRVLRNKKVVKSEIIYSNYEDLPEDMYSNSGVKRRVVKKVKQLEFVEAVKEEQSEDSSVASDVDRCGSVPLSGPVQDYLSQIFDLEEIQEPILLPYDQADEYDFSGGEFSDGDVVLEQSDYNGVFESRNVDPMDELNHPDLDNPIEDDDRIMNYHPFQIVNIPVVPIRTKIIGKLDSNWYYGQELSYCLCDYKEIPSVDDCVFDRLVSRYEEKAIMENKSCRSIDYVMPLTIPDSVLVSLEKVRPLLLGVDGLIRYQVTGDIERVAMQMGWNESYMPTIVEVDDGIRKVYPYYSGAVLADAVCRRYWRRRRVGFSFIFHIMSILIIRVIF